MAELVDALDLGSSRVACKSSSLFIRTQREKARLQQILLFFYQNRKIIIFKFKGKPNWKKS